MATQILRRFLANDTTAWPLNREEVGENLASGTYKVPEGWYVVNGIPRDFFEPDRSGKLESGFLYQTEPFIMERGYCSIRGGHTSNLIDLPSKLIKDHIPDFPEIWGILSVCARRELCIKSNKALEEIILEYRNDKAKQKRESQREINKRDNQRGESAEGLGEGSTASGETDGTMRVRDGGMVAPGEEREDSSLEVSEVSSGS